MDEMLAALDKFEEIIKDGIAPCVGRDGSLMDTFEPTCTEHALSDDGMSDEVPKTLPTLHGTPRDLSAATATTQKEAQTVTGAVDRVPTGTAERVPTGTDGTDEVTEGTTITDEVTEGAGVADEGDAEVSKDADRLIAGMHQSSILTKRHPATSASEGSDSSQPSSFTTTKRSKREAAAANGREMWASGTGWTERATASTYNGIVKRL